MKERDEALKALHAWLQTPSGRGSTHYAAFQAACLLAYVSADAQVRSVALQAEADLLHGLHASPWTGSEAARRAAQHSIGTLLWLAEGRPDDADEEAVSGLRLALRGSSTIGAAAARLDG